MKFSAPRTDFEIGRAYFTFIAAILVLATLVFFPYIAFITIVLVIVTVGGVLTAHNAFVYFEERKRKK